MLRAILRYLCAGLLASTATFSADPPVEPLTVCEVARDVPAQEGKNVAVLGRYSFRSHGRWISEDVCQPATNAVPQLTMVEDAKDGPKPPDNFELDAAALRRKFAALEQHTSLGKFRFGTPDYDRWAVVYGRVEARKADDTKKAAANLIYRGSGVIVFLKPEQ